MGWTSYYANHYKNGKIDRKAECDKVFNSGKNILEVVKSTMVGSTYYAAIREKKKFSREKGKVIDIPENEQVIFGVVLLTSVDGFYFGYKDMSEDMGPYKCDCPESILKLLTETDNECALEWRKRCHERNANKRLLKKATVGTRLKTVNAEGRERILVKGPVSYKKNGWIDELKHTYLTDSMILERGFEIIQEV